MKLYFLSFLIIFYSCINRNRNAVVCTMEFRTVAIKVNGDSLHSFFTIRQNTGDTIRFNQSNIFNNNSYPVLDDSYQSRIVNITENFRFIGIINDSIVVNEPFVIKADECHIQYVSGNLEVTL